MIMHQRAGSFTAADGPERHFTTVLSNSALAVGPLSGAHVPVPGDKLTFMTDVYVRNPGYPIWGFFVDYYLNITNKIIEID